MATKKEVSAALAAKVKTQTEEKAAEPLKNLPAKFKMPKKLADCADLLFTTRAERLQLQKIVDEKQAIETTITRFLIDSLPKDNASGIAGKMCRVSLVSKEVPQVNDWDAFYKFIAEEFKKQEKKFGTGSGAFALLQRRIGEKAVQELWEEDKAVPGVGKFSVTNLSVSKV